MPENHEHLQDGFQEQLSFHHNRHRSELSSLEAGTFSTCFPTVRVTSSPFTDTLGIHEVHLRRSDESGNEQVARCIVKVLRCIYLLNNSVFHNNDSCSECHSLCLVMSYVDDRCTKISDEAWKSRYASVLSALHPGWKEARP